MRFGDHFWQIFSGVGSHWGPSGVLSDDFWRPFSEVDFLSILGLFLGGAGGRGGACLSLQILQILHKDLITPCSPYAGVRRI